MRILMLTQFFEPVIGGEERHVASLCEGLVKRGHEATIVCLSHPDRPARASIRGSEVISIDGLSQRLGVYRERERRHAPPFPDPGLSAAIAGLIKQIQPDVVHGHNWLSRSILPIRSFTKAAFVVTLHDYSLVCCKKNLLWQGEPCEGPSVTKCPACASRHFGKLVGPVAYAGNVAAGAVERRVVDRYIAVSRAVASQCGLAEGGVPYDVLPTFIPDDVGTLSGEADHARDGKLPKEPFILFVGDLTRGKGVHVLLDAYKQLSGAPPLVLIGRRCADTPTDLPANVTLFESWPHHAVMRAWNRCLFGLAPSVWAEACGTIVMEANAVGKPMIVANTGGLADLVVSEQTGLLVPPGDAASLAKAMRRMLQEPGLRERLAATTRAHAERFMAKTIVPEIEDVYAKALQGLLRAGRADASPVEAKAQ